MRRQVLVFILVHGIEACTTLLGMSMGKPEMNPIVASLMEIAGPIDGILVSKIGATLLALVCLINGRTDVLTKANLFFAWLAVYNIAVLGGLI